MRLDTQSNLDEGSYLRSCGSMMLTRNLSQTQCPPVITAFSSFGLLCFPCGNFLWGPPFDDVFSLTSINLLRFFKLNKEIRRVLICRELTYIYAGRGRVLGLVTFHSLLGRVRTLKRATSSCLPRTLSFPIFPRRKQQYRLQTIILSKTELWRKDLADGSHIRYIQLTSNARSHSSQFPSSRIH